MSATTAELRELFGIKLSHDDSGAKRTYARALATFAAPLDDEAVEAHAAWFDLGVGQGNTWQETGIHFRAVTAKGITTLDHELDFDGSPDARFIPWSQVTQLSVIADSAPNTSDVTVMNSWIETTLGRVEFAGADSPEKHSALVHAVRRHLV